MIKKSDSRFAVVWFWKSIVWLQTELDSTQSYNDYKLASTLIFKYIYTATIVTKLALKKIKKSVKTNNDEKKIDCAIGVRDQSKQRCLGVKI